jgi:DNA-directed RNA polymerase specialized sigma24 family protein
MALCPPSAPDLEIEALVSSVAAGDEDAWRQLWHRLEARLWRLVRKRTFPGRQPRHDDDCRDVVVAIMARLRQHRFARIRRYLASRSANPHLSFIRWVIVVAKRVAIDCVRGHPDYVDRRRAAAGPSGVWIRSVPLPHGDLAGDAVSVITAVTARQIMSYAAGALSDPQRRALELWTEQLTHDEIARALALERPAEAARLVHSALARLRRRFRSEANPGPAAQVSTLSRYATRSAPCATP